jgi:hypothetical protein
MNGFILRVNSPMQPWDIGPHRFRGFLPVFLGEGYRPLDAVEKVQWIFKGWFHGQQCLLHSFPWFLTRSVPQCPAENAVGFQFFADSL